MQMDPPPSVGTTIPDLHQHTPAVTLEQRYQGTNVTEEDIARQNAFESGVRVRVRACVRVRVCVRPCSCVLCGVEFRSRCAGESHVVFALCVYFTLCHDQIVGDWAETVVETLTVSSKAFFEVIAENIEEVCVCVCVCECVSVRACARVRIDSNCTYVRAHTKRQAH